MAVGMAKPTKMTWITAGAVRRCIAVAVVLGAIVLSRGEAVAQVALFVNGEPITVYDIEQRSKLQQLTTHKPPNRQEVIELLINDKLKLQNAKYYKLEITDTEVDNAFANIARNVRIPVDQFTKQIQAQGVNPDALKSRLRADLAWAQIVRGKFASSLQVGDKDVAIVLESRKKESDIGYEYVLRPIMFVVPRGSSEAYIETRKRDAEGLRARFQDCEKDIRFASALRDVAVREPVRRSSADLSPQLREILNSIEVGRLTSPEVTTEGVQVFALCSKKESTSDTPGKKQVRDELFGEKFDEQAKRYLKQLRSQAMIEYRQ